MISISNIERFATHDGPGIRTTIFFKGCPLHCPWCSNPETWSVMPVLMHDLKKCTSCRRCEKVCPAQAIAFKEGRWTYDQKKCTQCKACEEDCLNEAISFCGQPYEIEELVKIALKDQDFYIESHGGITLSGGEVFMQFEELKQLLKQLKKHDLHIALETSGSYSNQKFQEIVNDVDLFLMDLKHIDPVKLNQVTGGNGKLVLENFKYLAKEHPEKVIIRTPVIPRFNEDKETIEAILDFAKDNHIAEVDLLPFHPLGKSKWIQLGKRYPYENEKMMEKEKLLPYIELGKQKGIKVRIGG